jgi:uncharacterized Ntn-hydrolase superfamily protein
MVRFNFWEVNGGEGLPSAAVSSVSCLLYEAATHQFMCQLTIDRHKPAISLLERYCDVYEWVTQGTLIRFSCYDNHILDNIC